MANIDINNAVPAPQQAAQQVALKKQKRAAKEKKRKKTATPVAQLSEKAINKKLEKKREKLGDKEAKMNKQIAKMKRHRLFWAISFFGGLIWSATIIGFFLGGEVLLFSTAPWQLFQWRRIKKKVDKQREKLKKLLNSIEELEQQIIAIKKQKRQQTIRQTLSLRKQALA